MYIYKTKNLSYLLHFIYYALYDKYIHINIYIYIYYKYMYIYILIVNSLIDWF